MKKTNVMIEVSEDLYDEVIHPYKKQKGFGRLVVQLLEAYRTNDSIYSYINGTMDKLEDEATKELLKDLNSMTQSLNMFGVLQNQAEVVIDEGKRAFDSFGEQATNDKDKYSINEDKENSVTREDVVNIVNDSVSEIKDMLQELLDKGVVSNPLADTVSRVVETKVNRSVQDVVPPNTVEKVIPHTEPLEIPVSPIKSASTNTISDKPIREVEKDDSEFKKEEDAAKNALSSLMGSISF